MAYLSYFINFNNLRSACQDLFLSLVLGFTISPAVFLLPWRGMAAAMPKERGEITSGEVWHVLCLRI